MTTPELMGQTQTIEYKTALPDITFRDLDVGDLPELKQLFELNADSIAEGGIAPDHFFQMTEQEVLGHNPHGHQRMGIWKVDQLVGCVAVYPAEYAKIKNAVEVSYVVDPKHRREGIARAVVEAVTDIENNMGHNVIAEVEPYNHASIRLLGKLGFALSGLSSGRNVYVHKTMTEEEKHRRLSR